MLKRYAGSLIFMKVRAGNHRIIYQFEPSPPGTVSVIRIRHRSLPAFAENMFPIKISRTQLTASDVQARSAGAVSGGSKSSGLIVGSHKQGGSRWRLAYLRSTPSTTSLF